MKDFLLSCDGVSKTFQDTIALNKASIDLYSGEILAILGPSGCGKSTLLRAIAGFEYIDEGTITINPKVVSSKDIFIPPEKRKVGMVFQDYALFPHLTVGSNVGFGIDLHSVTDKKALVLEMLKLVDLQGMDDRYPHEFSGGQRQRIGIARALAVNPSFIVCDEPVSALDVSIQAQVINLMEDLQEQFDLTYLFIAHDLSVVRHISDRIVVMYLGHIMEIADRVELYDNPLHPYTQALLSAIPIPDPVIEAKRDRIVLEGDVPSPSDPPAGCVFHTRCPIAVDDCKMEVPELKEVKPDHWVACIKAEGY